VRRGRRRRKIEREAYVEDQLVHDNDRLRHCSVLICAHYGTITDDEDTASSCACVYVAGSLHGGL